MIIPYYPVYGMYIKIQYFYIYKKYFADNCIYKFTGGDINFDSNS